MESNSYLQSSNTLNPIDLVMRSIFLDELTSFGIDSAEISIDSLLDSEVLKNIPIVKAVGALAKVSG